LLLTSGFPESYKVVVLALIVLSDLEDDGVESRPNPADGALLLRKVAALILIERPGEYLLCLIESDAALRVLVQ
jgi:hypothetical protein